MLYYGDGQRNGSMVPFNFYLMRSLKNDSTAGDIVNYINDWIKRMPPGVSANWVLGNHDNPRYSTRLGVQRADLFTILLQTLPGNAVTYNGEELGMTDGKVTWEQTVDPQGCMQILAIMKTTHVILAVHLTNGMPRKMLVCFSTADHTWLPVASNYRTLNALAQLRAPKSHLQMFMKLIRLRQLRSFQDGELKIKAIGDDIIIYHTEAPRDELFVIVLNLSGKRLQLNINEHFNMGGQAEVITSSLQSTYHDGDIVDPRTYVAEPYVGVVW
ncbi:unnamed protein product [Ceratitis capitata]|uniref:(Mediterranean fruit fly) hypothetical protein n=1 Tax=Ceratitis capitata TaxID=7213 RepID=A0A811VD85_CERCA|nr:unnamed protein product [Ceratitis capitata]